MNKLKNLIFKLIHNAHLKFITASKFVETNLNSSAHEIRIKCYLDINLYICILFVICAKTYVQNLKKILCKTRLAKWFACAMQIDTRRRAKSKVIEVNYIYLKTNNSRRRSLRQCKIYIWKKAARRTHIWVEHLYTQNTTTADNAMRKRWIVHNIVMGGGTEKLPPKKLIHRVKLNGAAHLIGKTLKRHASLCIYAVLNKYLTKYGSNHIPPICLVFYNVFGSRLV